MSSSINTVILVGRLTKDVELRKTSSGLSYSRFTVACDRRKDKDGNDTGADFIGCVAWRQAAEFIASYGTKGALVGINGSIQTGSYTDRDGKKVYTTDVLAERVQLLESKKARADYPNNGTSKSTAELAAEATQIFGSDLPDDAPFEGDDDVPW